MLLPALIGIMIAVVVGVSLIPAMTGTLEEEVLTEIPVEEVVAEEPVVTYVDTGEATREVPTPLSVILSTAAVILPGVASFFLIRRIQKRRTASRETKSYIGGEEVVVAKKKPRFTIFGIGVG